VAAKAAVVESNLENPILCSLKHDELSIKQINVRRQSYPEVVMPSAR
jgi:hypothetical protein